MRRSSACLGGLHICIYVPDVSRNKLNQKALKLTFVGYSIATKAYRLMGDETSLVYKRRDVTFNESEFGHKEVTTALNEDDMRKRAPHTYDIKSEADHAPCGGRSRG